MAYFKTACYLLIISAFANVTGHFLLSTPINEEEVKLYYLMAAYQKKFAGGSMSPKDIQDGLNLIYGLFFVFTGTLNLSLAWKRAAIALLKTVSAITAIVFALGTLISIVYFFWFPVILFASVSACFIMAYFRLTPPESNPQK